MKTLLHVGAGGSPAPRQYATYKETRLDVSLEAKPDIQASITSMPMVEDKAFDAVYASHVLEHVAWHEVHMALAEFHRVLNEEGILEIYVPDLQAIGGRLAADEPERLLYQSPMGPITALDMLYGHRGTVGMGHPGMAHKCGFTQSVLRTCLSRAGFTRVSVERSGPGEDPNLHVLAIKGSAGSAGQPERQPHTAHRLEEGNGHASQERSPTSEALRDEGRCVGQASRV